MFDGTSSQPKKKWSNFSFKVGVVFVYDASQHEVLRPRGTLSFSLMELYLPQIKIFYARKHFISISVSSETVSIFYAERCSFVFLFQQVLNNSDPDILKLEEKEAIFKRSVLRSDPVIKILRAGFSRPLMGVGAPFFFAHDTLSVLFWYHKDMKLFTRALHLRTLLRSEKNQPRSILVISKARVRFECVT